MAVQHPPNITRVSHYTCLSALNLPPALERDIQEGIAQRWGPLQETLARLEPLCSTPSDTEPSSHIKLLSVVAVHFTLYMWKRWWRTRCWPDWSERGRGQRSALHSTIRWNLFPLFNTVHEQRTVWKALVKQLQQCIAVMMRKYNPLSVLLWFSY